MRRQVGTHFEQVGSWDVSFGVAVAVPCRFEARSQMKADMSPEIL